MTKQRHKPPSEPTNQPYLRYYPSQTLTFPIQVEKVKKLAKKCPKNPFWTGPAVSQRLKRTLKILKYDKTTSQTSFRTHKPTLLAILPLTNTYFSHTSRKSEKIGQKMPQKPLLEGPRVSMSASRGRQTHL